MKSPIKEPAEVEIDQESSIGLERHDINNNDKSTVDNSEKIDNESKTKQILLRNDRVFALRQAGRWLLTLKRDESVFTTGVVVLNKEQTLSIRWDHGEIKKLYNKSDTVAYGDRMFVLDRDGLQKGSRVFLVNHPEITGTVLEKRYLVTANCVQDSDAVFEGIDSRALKRDSHGRGFKDNKVLYKGWLGITAGYRVRIYLKGNEDGCEFSVVDNGEYSENLVVGQEVKIGMNLLWGAQWTEGSNWITNVFRYYKTLATVAKIEMEELDVCWFGKAGNALVNSDPLEQTDAPDKLILYEDLPNAQYLISDYCHYMTSNSLWRYTSGPYEGPISKDAWATKWTKLVDWDRWEYPEPVEIENKHTYFDKEHVLSVNYTRSEVNVLWDSGNESTVNSADVIPIHLGTVWSDMLKYYPGTIVGDRLDHERKEKYGIIMRVEEMIATVKWITPHAHDGSGKENFDVTESTTALYDLYEKTEYDYVSRTNQCPVVYSEGRFEVGVVAGMNSATGQVCVKLPDGKQELAWPHELIHYKCDVTYCPKEGLWMTWYEHIVQDKNTVNAGVCPMTSDGNEIKADDDGEKLNTSILLESSAPKKQLEDVNDVPPDNIFALEDILPRLRETRYRHALEVEVEEMEQLPEGIWVEYYHSRGDIMSAVLAGPKDTVFEDFLFIFDIFLLEDFPSSDPYINFRSMGVTLFPRHFCKTGAVFLPEETRIAPQDFTQSYITNVLLEIKDFMAMPLETILDKDSADTPSVKQEDPEELHKFLLLSVLDYTIALLRNPPKNWSSLINYHFAEAIPKIVERYESGKTQFRRVAASVSNEKVSDSNGVGDVVNLDGFELLTDAWSESYKESLRSRVNQLESMLSSSSSQKK